MSGQPLEGKFWDVKITVKGVSGLGPVTQAQHVIVRAGWVPSAEAQVASWIIAALGLEAPMLLRAVSIDPVYRSEPTTHQDIARHGLEHWDPKPWLSYLNTDVDHGTGPDKTVITVMRGANRQEGPEFHMEYQGTFPEED